MAKSLADLVVVVQDLWAAASAGSPCCSIGCTAVYTASSRLPCMPPLVGRCVYRHSAVYTATRRASCIPPLLGRRLFRQSSAAVYLGTRRQPCIPPLVGRHTLSRLGLGTRTGGFVGGGRARDRSAQASSQTGPAQNAKIHHPKHPSRAHHVVDAADHLRPADLPESPATATLQLPRMGVCLGRLRILYCLCRTCGPWGLGASVSGLGLGTRTGVSVRVGWAKERS